MAWQMLIEKEISMATATQTVREIALEQPTSIRVFERFGIDYCCGGRKPLTEACAAIQIEPADLLAELQRSLGLTYLFIAHDLSVVRHLADRVAVLYVGKIVELAAVEDLFTAPRHPYTEALLAAMPIADPHRARPAVPLPGEPADPAAPPPGCAFHPRCRYASPLCRGEVPALRELAPGHQVRCHHAEVTHLHGVEEETAQDAK